MDNVHQLHPTAFTKITALKFVKQAVSKTSLYSAAFSFISAKMQRPRCNRSNRGCRPRRYLQGRKSLKSLCSRRDLAQISLFQTLTTASQSSPEPGSEQLLPRRFHATLITCLCSQKHLLLTATPEQIAVLLLPGKLPAPFSPSPASQPWVDGMDFEIKSNFCQSRSTNSPEFTAP